MNFSSKPKAKVWLRLQCIQFLPKRCYILKQVYSKYALFLYFLYVCYAQLHPGCVKIFTALSHILNYCITIYSSVLLFLRTPKGQISKGEGLDNELSILLLYYQLQNSVNFNTCTAISISGFFLLLSFCYYFFVWVVTCILPVS